MKIPELKMPTPEEHRAASLAWLKPIQPTLIDQWPDELAALSMPTKFVQIDVPEFWDSVCDMHDGRGIGNPMRKLANDVDRALDWDRHFIRLNSRSPKDFLSPFKVPVTLSGKEAVMMIAGSMRTFDDLMEFKYLPEQPAYVCLRRFVHGLRPSNEFRCFVKDGDLIAVTHYDYYNPVPDWIKDNLKDIRKKLDKYFREKLAPALHVSTVVFDIAYVSGDFLLIEINPYGLSDPCHFGSYKNVESADGYIQIFNPEGD